MSRSQVSEFSSATDADLVAASARGEKDAFGVIVSRYQGLITGMLYNRCNGDISLSEELAQQTFVKAWESLGNLRDTTKLSSWLCGIARNVHLNSLRKSSRHVQLDPSVEIISNSGEPSAEIISREQQQLVWNSLESIPEKYREPMVMFYRQDHSVSVVAEALGENEATIRKRLQRGREMLREEVVRSVEGTLRRSAPSIAFTTAVLAALPMFTGKASAATVGVSTVGTVAATSKLAALAMWLGPLAGLFGGIYGAWCSYKSAESPRERRHVLGGIVLVCVFVAVLFAAQFTLNAYRPSLERQTYLMLLTTIWLVYGSVLMAFISIANRRQARIRVEDGTAKPIEKRKHTPSPRVLFATMFVSVSGALAWILVMAWLVGDVTWLAVVLTSLVIFSVWTYRELVQQGVASLRKLTLSSGVFTMLTYVATVNLRLNTWLAQGHEQGGQLKDFGWNVDHISLPMANLFLAVIAFAMLGQMYVATRNYTVDAATEAR